LIRAIRPALGPDGTLVMPSMSDDDDHAFDVRTTPCIGMGVVADTFWRMPGVRRSDSPHAFAALGPEADRITAAHPWDFPHGLDSPVGRVYELDGQVLLLGVGHDANTTIHLAEALAGVRYRRRKSLTLVVASVTDRLRTNETVFLHEPGVDAECEDARASIRNPPAAPTDASARRAPSTKFGPD
jgi:aminoglycoside N3'-acetyltransferase